MRHISKEEYSLMMKKIKSDNEQIELRAKLRAEKNKSKKFKKPKMKTSNIVLIASITAVVLFTIACLFIQYRTAVEVSSTLITLWYSFWTVEIVALTGIKISKVIKNYTSDSNVESNNAEDNSDAVG